MATVHQFEDLECWQMARAFANKIGKLIDEGRFGRNYRLTGQLEGSTGSIMDNIAEGFERGSRGEFITFLGYAKGSCGEIRSQLYRSLDRGYFNQEEFDDLKDEAKRISGKLQNFINYLGGSDIAGSRKKPGSKPTKS